MGEWEFRFESLKKGLEADKLTIGLFFGDFLNMDAPFLTVHSLNLTFSGFKASSHDFDYIAFSDWDGSHFVLSL